MDNQEQTQIIAGKTLIVNPVNHKALSLMKIEGDFKSIDDLISALLETDRQMKILSLATENKKEKKKNGNKK